MMRIKLISLLLVFSGISVCSLGQIDTVNNAKLAKNAPVDKSHPIESSEKQKQYEKMIAPYVEQALKTLPGAKQRFLSGLKPGEVFFLVTRIYDKDGKMEQVFIRIKKWDNENIKGLIGNDLYCVKEYRRGQMIDFKEKDVLDWVISKPDGSEEGNFIGKFLDTLSK
jgi:uncharacterized protein YegJ (DUF2314 family)